MIQVKPGELWEFKNKESSSWDRYMLVWIMEAELNEYDPFKDRYTYLVLDDECDVQHGYTESSLLTIRAFPRLWERLA